MAPSLARQAWVFCCNTICSERVLSPVLVLLVHGLLVADVAYHRREVWQDVTLWYRSVRLLVVATITLYLGTSCTNPGYVENEPGSDRDGGSCPCCLLLCCALCARGSAGGKVHLATARQDDPEGDGTGAPMGGGEHSHGATQEIHALNMFSFSW